MHHHCRAKYLTNSTDKYQRPLTKQLQKQNCVPGDLSACNKAIFIAFPETRLYADLINGKVHIPIYAVLDFWFGAHADEISLVALHLIYPRSLSSWLLQRKD